MNTGQTQLQLYCSMKFNIVLFYDAQTVSLKRLVISSNSMFIVKFIKYLLMMR